MPGHRNGSAERAGANTDPEIKIDVVDIVEDLDLDELTQEDKFFLIQQIEDLNKNIRYC